MEGAPPAGLLATRVAPRGQTSSQFLVRAPAKAAPRKKSRSGANDGRKRRKREERSRTGEKEALHCFASVCSRTSTVLISLRDTGTVSKTSMPCGLDVMERNLDPERPTGRAFPSLSKKPSASPSALRPSTSTIQVECSAGSSSSPYQTDRPVRPGIGDVLLEIPSFFGRPSRAWSERRIGSQADVA